MEEREEQNGKVQRSGREHRVLRPTQTGFTSPATHYAEPRIDLNEVLVDNPNSTFFMRVADTNYKEYGIVQKDVLIIDKSILPKPNQLACVTTEGKFEIKRIEADSKEEIEVWGTITYVIKSML
jgi:DNA polymerase V